MVLIYLFTDISPTEEIYLVTCPVIFGIIISILCAVIFYLRSLRRYVFPTIQQAYQYYSVAIFKTYYNWIIILGSFMIITGTAVLVLYSFQDHLSSYDKINVSLGTISLSFGLLILGIVFNYRIYNYPINKQFIDNPPWARALTRNSLTNNRVSELKLIGFLRQLRLLVGCICVIAILITLWGIIEIPLYILDYDNYYYLISDFGGFILLFSGLKFTIAALLYLGTYFLMISPLKKWAFWNRMLDMR